jgi:hypothetical protein
MKLTFKEKAKLFWDRNKKEILGMLIATGVISGIGCGLAYFADKADKQRKANEAEWRREIEEAARKKAEEEMAEERRIAGDPENQIVGGYVRPDNDDLSNPVYPSILINTVPVANMGKLGQEVVRRLNE